MNLRGMEPYKEAIKLANKCCIEIYNRGIPHESADAYSVVTVSIGVNTINGEREYSNVAFLRKIK